MSIRNNTLIRKHFDYGGEEYVVTWNDKTHFRATPLSCATGLTSVTFTIKEIGVNNMRHSSDEENT